MLLSWNAAGPWRDGDVEAAAHAAGWPVDEGLRREVGQWPQKQKLALDYMPQSSSRCRWHGKAGSPGYVAAADVWPSAAPACVPVVVLPSLAHVYFSSSIFFPCCGFCSPDYEVTKEWSRSQTFTSCRDYSSCPSAGVSRSAGGQREQRCCRMPGVIHMKLEGKGDGWGGGGGGIWGVVEQSPWPLHSRSWQGRGCG